MKLSPRQIALSLVFGFLLTLLGVFWIVQQVRTPPSPNTVDPMRLNLSEFRNLGLYKTGNSTFLLRLVAKQWVFDIGQQRDTPAYIQIPAGSTLQIVTTSMDFMHSVHVPGNPAQPAIPGKITRQTYTFPQPGLYTTTCSEYCGPKHTEMILTIDVTPSP